MSNINNSILNKKIGDKKKNKKRIKNGDFPFKIKMGFIILINVYYGSQNRTFCVSQNGKIEQLSYQEDFSFGNIMLS